jgi:hypothetical protein
VRPWLACRPWPNGPLALSADGKYLADGDEQGVCLWDAVRGKRVASPI